MPNGTYQSRSITGTDGKAENPSLGRLNSQSDDTNGDGQGTEASGVYIDSKNLHCSHINCGPHDATIVLQACPSV